MKLKLILPVLSVLVFLAAKSSFQPSPAVAQDAPPPAGLEPLLERFMSEFVAIQPGTAIFPRSFVMGGATGGPLAIPPKEVVVPRFFRIHRYETTQELYEAVMGNNPSRWKGRRNSVEMVSYQDAVTFCARITSLLQARRALKPTERVRLPTETEWEYSCRAGSTTLYSFGNDPRKDGDEGELTTLLNEHAWHTGNAAGNDPEVGVLKPNAWNLYDMHGYLWEFVADPYAAWTESESILPDSPTPASQSLRVLRGGSWRDHYSMLTCDFRLAIPDHAVSDAIGFRCVIAEE